jgi:hypothetical protein
VGRGEVVDEDFVEVIDAFDGDPAVFRIQGFAHLMPSLTQLAELHVLDLRVAHREDAAKATARTHWRHMFDHSDETSAWESAFPAHWDRRNLNSHWVHRAIYISPPGDTRQRGPNDWRARFCTESGKAQQPPIAPFSSAL